MSGNEQDTPGIASGARRLHLFRRNTKDASVQGTRTDDYTGDEPVIRCSICTGEQSAGFIRASTGRFEEIMLIRNGKDLEDFCRTYHIHSGKLRKIY